MHRIFFGARWQLLRALIRCPEIGQTRVPLSSDWIALIGGRVQKCDFREKILHFYFLEYAHIEARRLRLKSDNINNA
jgi:hypothetical protein